MAAVPDRAQSPAGVSDGGGRDQDAHPGRGSPTSQDRVRQGVILLPVAGGGGEDGTPTRRGDREQPRKKTPKTVAELFGERKFKLIEAAARDAELTCFAFRVFVALVAHANRDTWEMRPSAETLREAIHGKNVRSVQHALVQIRQLGYVELVSQGGG